MAQLNGEPHRIKLYNLPQRVEGGIKIYSPDRKRVYRFHKLDGMWGKCTIESNGDPINFHVTTPLVELGNDEYQIVDDEASEKSN